MTKWFSNNPLIFLVSLLFIALLVSSCASATPKSQSTAAPTQAASPQIEVVATGTSQAGANIANPASQNCLDKGGKLAIETRGDGGQMGVCYFEDNRQCEEWALMRGNCPVGGLKVTGYITQAGRYCAITGGRYAITSNNGAGGEQGTCIFKDGSQCDALAYYNGSCTLGSTPSGSGKASIQPLTMEVCDGEAQAMAHALDVVEVTQSEEALTDPVNGASGTGCQSTVKSSGVKFNSPNLPVNLLSTLLKDEGWKEDQQLESGGPTGMGKGFRKDNQICLAAAMWTPDASANCSKDQPISACTVTPEQQIYTVTLLCGEESAAQ